MTLCFFRLTVAIVVPPVSEAPSARQRLQRLVKYPIAHSEYER